MQTPPWVTTLRQQVDSWATQQRAAMQRVGVNMSALNTTGWPPWHWKLKLPWKEDKKRKQELQEEYRRRKMQIEDLCEAVKVDDFEDLQDVLGAMVLSECAYKVRQMLCFQQCSVFSNILAQFIQILNLTKFESELFYFLHNW
jgi:hypothetical protein